MGNYPAYPDWISMMFDDIFRDARRDVCVSPPLKAEGCQKCNLHFT